MGRLIDADKLSFYGFFDAGDYSVVRQTIYNAPTVEAIPKAEYEARLKSDMVDMLTEIQLEIEEYVRQFGGSYKRGYNTALLTVEHNIIKQKINALKAESEGKE